jgi:REP element-mobilizing transposase RayT
MSSQPHQPPRKSTRLQGYDYAQNGAYFVTLCTQNRLCLFGEIETDEMRPNDSGHMILRWWNELQTKFPNIELDSFVLMPNHVHGIIFLFDGTTVSGAHAGAPLQNHPLDNIMQWFKTMTTNAYIRGVKEQGWEAFLGKLWQRSFHDHIIRNEDDLNTHRQYILSNPAQWASDDNNPSTQ